MGVGMIIGGALGAGTKLLEGYGGAAAQGAAIDQSRRQKVEIIKSMNWNAAKTDLDIKSQWDSAVAELSEMNMQAIRNRTSVEAGISESGMEGRTMRQIQRSVEGQDLKAKSRLKENYERDYQSLLNKKQDEWDQGLATIEGIPKVNKTSGFSQALGVLSGGLQGVMAGNQLQTQINTPQGARGK